jgi:membrane protease YdiL (CAAX protease family)
MRASDVQPGAAGLPVLPLKTVLPGLAAITAVDILAWLGWWEALPGHAILHPALLLIAPWAALWISRAKPDGLGYRSGRILLDLGWGAVAGACWRLASLLLNMALLGWPAGSLERWLSALIWIPFLEETFFRGYLGRSLQGVVGVWPGILLQALLFTLQPNHLDQGWSAVLGVFGFGILAGWLLHRRGSLWAAWGAHAMANAIVIPLTSFA